VTVAIGQYWINAMAEEETMRLGHSSVEVSALGLGTAAIGGLYTPVSADDAAAVVGAALDAGITYFDTAPLYGLGESERRLGRALAGVDRSAVTVSTKVGRLIEPRPGGGTDVFAGVDPADIIFDLSAEGVHRSLDASLDRLGLDRVDVVFVHDPDDGVDQAIAEAYPALERWRDEGVVGAIGVGMNQNAVPLRFVRETDIDVVLLAGRWTLLDQSGLAELLPACTAAGVSVVVGGVFNSDVLADPHGRPHYDYGAAPADVVARALELEAACRAAGVELLQAALAFPRLHPAVASVLVGTRSVAELTADVEAARAPVPGGLWAGLVGGGLLDPAVGALSP
jgi:D-threo-aldose 1-dehydrogenase